jgi:hypothetical protein
MCSWVDLSAGPIRLRSAYGVSTFSVNAEMRPYRHIRLRSAVSSVLVTERASVCYSTVRRAHKRMARIRSMYVPSSFTGIFSNTICESNPISARSCVSVRV